MEVTIKDIERRLNEMKTTCGSKPSDTERLRELCEEYKPTNMKKMKALLEKGADVNAEYGIYPKKTILRSVCDTYTPKKLELVKFLIENGADVNAKNNEYPPTSIIQSVCESYTPQKLELVKLLIEKGADINAEYGRYPTKTILRSVCESYTPLKKELLETLLKNNNDEICRASLYNYSEDLTYVDFLSMAIHAGFDPNYQDDSGRTILHIVAHDRLSDIETVDWLCSLMTDINIYDTIGDTPWPAWAGYDMSVDAQERYVRLSKIFLSYGASPFVGSHNKVISLLCLSLVDTMDIIRDIYSTRDINEGDGYGRTVLHRAVEYGNNTQVATGLVRLGAKVNIADLDGDTPLHMTALYGDITNVEELIRLGAKVNIQNNHGDTPLHTAVMEGNMAVSQNLIKNGANVVIQNKNGHTPLHLAALSGKNPNIECIKSLMTLDSWFIKDCKGETFIDILRPYNASQLLTKALQIDPSLRVFEECIASLTYKERKRVRELLLVLNRSPIPTSLFPSIIANTFEEYEYSDGSSDGSSDSD
jgi:ankyrin repeat protein